MTMLTDEQMDRLLHGQSIVFAQDNHVSMEFVRKEIERRKKKRVKAACVAVLPASLILFGAGYAYQDIGQLDVQTQHVIPSMSQEQRDSILHGSPLSGSDLSVLIGWLQSQMSWNPNTWDTAPFKSYKILGITQQDENHATASIEILLQNGQWSKRLVPMVRSDRKWGVSISKYGEPSAPRHISVR